MPAFSPDTTRLDVEHAGGSGRWVRLEGCPGRVEFTTGRTGNSLDPEHRVPLSRIELSAGRGRVAVRSRWPVAEVLTNCAGEVLDDLRGELREAEDPDPSATVDRLVSLVVPNAGSGPTDPAARILAIAYPLLAAPIAAGARPNHVPVAVEPVVGHDTPRDAAEATLRPTATTRPLVRALAQALMPDDTGAIGWERILLALMAAQRCGPEQLTAILSSRVDHPGAVSFSVAEIQRARWMFADRHPRRVAEVLCAALEQPGGTAELAREIAAFSDRPPAPPPRDEPAPRRRVIDAPDPNRQVIAHPPSIRAIEGQTVDGLRVVLPRSPDELLEWGAAMSNCLGAYRGPVGRGHTHIIGFVVAAEVFPDGSLELVAEVSRAKVLRQLEEPGNLPPSPRRSRAVVEFLREHHVVEADGRQA